MFEFHTAISLGDKCVTHTLFCPRDDLLFLESLRNDGYNKMLRVLELVNSSKAEASIAQDKVVIGKLIIEHLPLGCQYPGLV